MPIAGDMMGLTAQPSRPSPILVIIIIAAAKCSTARLFEMRASIFDCEPPMPMACPASFRRVRHRRLLLPHANTMIGAIVSREREAMTSAKRDAALYQSPIERRPSRIATAGRRGRGEAIAARRLKYHDIKTIRQAIANKISATCPHQPISGKTIGARRRGAMREAMALPPAYARAALTLVVM